MDSGRLSVSYRRGQLNCLFGKQAVTDETCEAGDVIFTEMSQNFLGFLEIFAFRSSLINFINTLFQKKYPRSSGHFLVERQSTLTGLSQHELG